MMGGGAPDQARITEGLEGVKKAFGIIDPVLGKPQFLAGDSFSLAEVSWMPYMDYFAAAGPCLACGISMVSSKAVWYRRRSWTLPPR